MMRKNLVIFGYIALLVGANTLSAAQNNATASLASPMATSATTGPASTSSPQFQARDPRYKIESGDVFDITFE